MRIVLMGTSGFAVPTFSALHTQSHQIVAVYTRPPLRAGRGMKLRKSAVHVWADQEGLPVRTPENFSTSEEQAVFQAHLADLVIVVDYGLILPDFLLRLPRYGCLNLHASLLPRWRGAAPIQRAIMAGDTRTGVTVMYMEKGLDSGPICKRERVDISPDMTADQLRDLLAVRGADLMQRAVSALAVGDLDSEKQPEEGITYAKKIRKEETRIDWSRSASILRCQIHAFSSVPGAWCELQLHGKVERIKILHVREVDATGAPGTLCGEGLTVACGEGALQICRLQRAGRSSISGEEFLRGVVLDGVRPFL